MCEDTLRMVDPNVPVRMVHASRGKATRAEPVSALYEQGKIHHVGGFPELEDQLCSFCPGTTDSHDDRLDSLVWAFSELMTQPCDGWGILEFARLEAEKLSHSSEDSPQHGWSIGAQEGESTFAAPPGAAAAGWDTARDFFASRGVR